MRSASVSVIICTYVHKLSCIQRANVMIGCDMIVRAVHNLAGMLKFSIHPVHFFYRKNFPSRAARNLSAPAE